jgi:hypothetical protein
MKWVVGAARGEKAGRNARDGYPTEHMEIASYQLLERVAVEAGDEETAEVARRSRRGSDGEADRPELRQGRRALACGIRCPIAGAS